MIVVVGHFLFEPGAWILVLLLLSCESRNVRVSHVAFTTDDGACTVVVCPCQFGLTLCATWCNCTGHCTRQFPFQGAHCRFGDIASAMRAEAAGRGVRDRRVPERENLAGVGLHGDGGAALKTFRSLARTFNRQQGTVVNARPAHGARLFVDSGPPLSNGW